MSEDNNKENLNDLNYAINKGSDPANFYNQKNNNKDQIIKIITIILITILLIAMISSFVYIIINKNKNGVNSNEDSNNNNQAIELANETAISNEIIVDNTSETINRKYGRIEVVWVDKSNNIIKKPLQPELKGLQPVKYTNSKFINTTLDDNAWYDYENQKWANAINSDGSYFVWIPRYAYKIVYYSDSTYQNVVGYCDYRGILKINSDKSLTRIYSTEKGITEVGNHYILQPAFMKDVASGYKNGGWDSEISGIWVAKYEMSMEKDNKHIETSSTENGNILVDSTTKAVSKPGVTSWRNISVNNCYKNGYNYDRNKESHLIKNSEWGAVAYLSYSKFGTNCVPITLNNNLNYVTGGNEIESEIYLYNGKESTTGNATGMYDFNGGAWEIISGYINNGYSGLKVYGGENDGDVYGTAKSNKYKTVYSNSNTDKGGTDYSATYANANYNLASYRRGEAIFETSISGFGNDSWNNNSSFYLQQDTPFFSRGGDFNSITGGGAFCFKGISGQANQSEGFRVVII